MYGNQTVNHQALMAAQSKAVIARFLGDAGMLLQANKQMKAAVSMPWYRRPQ
ncbi:host cell division inhibitory peptide Kil [Cronobacter sakazakii]|uniref:host cell division inhibitory peptide Kil n=1 Tax=Cronobacter sakazakii TaxID=28141 RepID=UPI000BE8C452|nr:host cell division inhibitory peptide Kil [Cronobacter sakazakii]PUV58014.1 host cell division inhibitory peptide Kil [Cronobacter sakazakii]